MCGRAARRGTRARPAAPVPRTPAATFDHQLAGDKLHKDLDEATQSCTELEERILRCRDSHNDAVEEVNRSAAEGPRQGSERLEAVHCELLAAKHRCELLMRDTADP